MASRMRGFQHYPYPQPLVSVAFNAGARGPRLCSVLHLSEQRVQPDLDLHQIKFHRNGDEKAIFVISLVSIGQQICLEDACQPLVMYAPFAMFAHVISSPRYLTFRSVYDPFPVLADIRKRILPLSRLHS